MLVPAIIALTSPLDSMSLDLSDIVLTLLAPFGVFGLEYLYYILGMAGNELIKVIIDIEANTRRGQTTRPVEKFRERNRVAKRIARRSTH